MSDIVAEAILQVTTATRRIGQESAHSSTRVTRDGDHFSFALPENDTPAGRGTALTTGIGVLVGLLSNVVKDLKQDR